MRIKPEADVIRTKLFGLTKWLERRQVVASGLPSMATLTSTGVFHQHEGRRWRHCSVHQGHKHLTAANEQELGPKLAGQQLFKWPESIAIIFMVQICQTLLISFSYINNSLGTNSQINITSISFVSLQFIVKAQGSTVVLQPNKRRERKT